jgi:hypothetical protein
LRAHPQFIAKKKADEQSYVWDRLIQTFTNHMLAGTTIVPDDAQPFDLREHERGIRHMALVPRYLRRPYGEAIIDVLLKGQRVPRFTRAIIPKPDEPEGDTGFFFMTLSVPDSAIVDYERYRAVRREMLTVYAGTFLHRYKHLNRVVGIASEPFPKPGQRHGSSEDLIVAEHWAWDDKTLDWLREGQEFFGITQPGNFREYSIRGDEYPLVAEKTTAVRGGPNRRQRRAARAKARRE